MWSAKANRIELGDELEASIRDEWDIFFELEAIPQSEAEPFSWRYTWGYSYDGWTRADGISTSSPEFKGSKNQAGKAYLMMDTQALLETHMHYGNVRENDTKRFSELLQSALREGEMGLFAFRHAADFKRSGIDFSPLREQLLRALRPTGFHELRGSVWAAALWVNSGFGEGDFELQRGALPSLDISQKQLLAKAGEEIPIADFLTSYGAISEDMKIEIRDAHCGRGYFTKDGQMLKDRITYTYSINDDIRYVATSLNREYDEIHLTLVNRYGASEKLKLRVEARGDTQSVKKNRSKTDWRVVGNQCKYVPG